MKPLYLLTNRLLPTFNAIMAILAMASLGSCTTATSATAQQDTQHTVRGYVFTAGNLDYLSNNAHIEVEVNLLETRTPDSVPLVLRQLRLAGPNQWPLAFELAYDPALLDPAFTYSLQAMASSNSQLVAITTDQHRFNPDINEQSYDLLMEVLGDQSEPITGYTIYCGLDNYDLSIYGDKVVNDDLQTYQRLIFTGITTAGESHYQRENQELVLAPQTYPEWIVKGNSRNCGP